MGAGCSRPPTKPAGQGKTNPQKKAGPRLTSKGNPAAVAAKGKSPDRQPLCRAIGFATARSAPINGDLGSKGSRASIRSNSYWLHEDDDRVDAVINRWKSSEILLLQGLFQERLQIQKRHKPQLPLKGRSHQSHTATEGLRLPVDVLIAAMTSKRIFIAGSGTFLGIALSVGHTNSDYEETTEPSLLCSTTEASSQSNHFMLPPLIVRLDPSANDTSRCSHILSSPYVCEPAAAESPLPLPQTRFPVSSQSVGYPKKVPFSKLERCIPIWGLTAKGMYQALCVQTLAMSVSPLTPLEAKLTSNPSQQKNRIFHFHIRRSEGLSEGETRRDKIDEEFSHVIRSLSLDFKDFGRAVAIMGGKGTREEMLILLFLLFAEPIIPVSESTSRDPDGGPPNGLKTDGSYPRSCYNDTIGCSSPRDIALTVGSQRVLSTNSPMGEKDDVGEVLALTKVGLDCLVRFLIISQAIAADNSESENPVTAWANSILHLESEDCQDTEGARERPRYSFSVQSEASAEMTPFASCTGAHIPLTLPFFLASLNDSCDCFDSEKDAYEGDFPFHVVIPDTRKDVAAAIFSTASIAASLSMFVEDIKLTDTATSKDTEKDKGVDQQVEGADALAMSSTGELKEEPDTKILNLSPVADPAKEVCFTNSNSSSHSRQKVSTQTGGSSELAASNVQSTARKNRKSHNVRVISPSPPLLVPVPFEYADSSHDGIQLSPDDLDDCSVGSAGTLSGDSTGNHNPAQHAVGKKTSSMGLNSWTPSSYSCGAGGSAQDGILPTRSRSLTTSASQSLLSGSRNEISSFTSSACGLNNLGNTCFMSSALQCFVHSPLLKEYFLSGKYKEHLNPKNPLGTKGAILTKAFAQLIESMAHKSKAAAESSATASLNIGNAPKKPLKPSTTPASSSPRSSSSGTSPSPGCSAPSFAPHEFRRDLQACKSQFQGQEQQDVQEFLAELMDALHEDLNRHTKYSAPSAGAGDETPPNPAPARRAAKPWRLLTGYSAKRNMTVNTISNATIEKDLDKEEEGDVGLTTAPKSVDSAIAVQPSDSPPPMSVEMQGTVAWEQHLVRNRSCIVDLFQGQLCSAVTCNECGNVSRTFDPFTSLSLPLPVQHDITVMVTMLRRMPRPSSAVVRLAVGRDGSSKAAAVIDEIHAAQMMASEPIRMVVVLPRLSDMSDLRKAICQMLSPPAQKGSSSSSYLPAENGSTTAPYTLSPDNLMLLDCFRSVLQDSQSILRLIEEISRSAAAAASAFTDTVADSSVAPSNNPDNRSAKGSNTYNRSESTPTGSPAASSLKRSDSPAAKFVQENSSGMTLHCVALENPKDIPFICSLSPSRLGSRSARATPPANFNLSPAGGATERPSSDGAASDDKADDDEGSSHTTSAFNPNFYTDQLEYQEGSLDPTEGDIVADLDFEGTNSPKQSAGEKADDRTAKRKKDIWPSSIEGLTLGRRVDAQDQGGQWRSGTVMDRWKVTAEDLFELAAERSHMAMGNGMGSSNPICSKGKRRGGDESAQLNRRSSRLNPNKDRDRSKGPKTLGWNIRIHFDALSDRWDEWISASDFEQRLARVYTLSKRKFKVMEIAIVQRQITLRNSSRSGGSQSGSEAGQSKTFSVMTVFGCPIMLQCESWRSCEHIYRVIAEQSVRYASPGQMRRMVESSVNRVVSSETNCPEQHQSSSECSSLPFSIRVISATSTTATDNLEGLEMDLGLIKMDGRGKVGVPRRARARPPIPSGRPKSTDGFKEGDVPPYSSILDRANGFQSWEGSYFPRDPLRPICNLMHDCLLVAVDWHWNSTSAPTSGQGKGSVSFRDHESYTKYITTLIPPSIPMAAIEVPRKDKEELQGSNGCSSSSSPSTPDLVQPTGPGARSPSSSAHPSLVDCLRSFTGTEELEEGAWHCDHCKKLSSGSVSSSLSRLPDLLIMHIKRFGMTARFREKIREKVVFPLTSLDMKPFVNLSAGGDSEATDDSRYLYDLYAVANHLGGMSGGHYTAMVKCNAEVLSRPAVNGIGTELSRSSSYDRNPPPVPVDGTERQDAAWMCFDDDVVTAIPAQALEATIVSEKAYVLFYKRRQLTSSNIVNLCS